MYAIAINGSPRVNGNTAQLIQQVMQPLSDNGWETEVYHLGGKPVHGCTSCRACVRNQNRKCIISSDCINEIIEKMDKASAIIIGTPTYFSNVTTEVKALLDRGGFVAKANGGMFKGKIGAAVAAVRRAGAVHAAEAIMRMYLINGMIIPGSTYWNMGIGLEPGDSLRDDEGVTNMRHLGECINLLGKAVEPYARDWPW